MNEGILKPTIKELVSSIDFIERIRAVDIDGLRTSICVETESKGLSREQADYVKKIVLEGCPGLEEVEVLVWADR